VQPYRIYVGYDNVNVSRSFTDYVVRNAPCDVAVIKQDAPNSVVRWVGISARNFDMSGSALIKAFKHSHPGDKVVAVHYPVNPFDEAGLSSVYERHYTSLADDHLDVLVDSMQNRVLERVERLAETHLPQGVKFRTFLGQLTEEPHLALVRDATRGVLQERPSTVYVGYNRRQDRNRLVEPGKLYDVAEYIVKHAPCNVVIIKETQEEMLARIRERKKLSVA